MGLKARDYLRRAKLAFADTPLEPLDSSGRTWVVTRPTPRWLLRGITRDPRPNYDGGVILGYYGLFADPDIDGLDLSPTLIKALPEDFDEGVFQLKQAWRAVPATEAEGLRACVVGPPGTSPANGNLGRAIAAVLLQEWKAAADRLARLSNRHVGDKAEVIAALQGFVQLQDHAGAYAYLDHRAEAMAEELGIDRAAVEDDPLRPL